RASLEAQQKTLWKAVGESSLGPTAYDETRLWANYKLLQIFDRFSLYLCMPPYAERTLGPAPLDGQGKETELTFTPPSERTIVVRPYPFRESPIELTVGVRFIPNRDYRDDDDLRATLAAAEEQVLTVEVRS